MVRDIFVMGAKVLGCGVSLRTGPLTDPHSRYILEEGTKGVANHCNILGVPLVDLILILMNVFKIIVLNVSAIGIVQKIGFTKCRIKDSLV